MKKLALAVVGLAWTSFAFAGEYHVFDKLICSDCHTMHSSRSHEFGSTAAEGDVGPNNDATGHDKLLIGTSVNNTCLTCHDGATDAPDVYAADANGGVKRSAGALNGATSLQTAHPNGTYDTYMGHTMASPSTVLPPGITTPANWTLLYDGVTAYSEEFNCSDCHGVHGTSSYRNLGNKYGRKSAADAAASIVTYTVGTFNPAYDVTIASGNDRTAPFATTKTKFDTTNITFGAGSAIAGYGGGTATTAAYGMNQFCAGCHGNFHGLTTASTNIYDSTGGAYIRHPTSSANRQIASGNNGTIVGAQTDLVRPLWKTTDETRANGTFDVGCLTCHKAHGNANGFALLLPGNNDATTAVGARTSQLGVGGGTNYENGDNAQNAPVRALCITCHGMGATNTY